MTKAVTADGGYALPALTPGAAGYYSWRVAVDGTPTALPVAACGAVTAVKAVASVTVTALNPEMQPGNAEVRVSLSGLPRLPAVDVTLSVRGPYATQQALTAGNCSGAIDTSVDQKMNGDATVMLYPYVDETGWYGLQATVPAGSCVRVRSPRARPSAPCCTSPETAGRLHLGYGTVKTHVSHLLTKLDCRDRAQLVMYAYESGHAVPGGN